MDLSLVPSTELGLELPCRALIQSFPRGMTVRGKPSFGDVDGIVLDESRTSGQKQFC